MTKLLFSKSRNPKNKNLGLKDKKFKLYFNIGSNWGPHLPMGRGEHVDSVPLLGKWCQGFIIAKLLRERKKRDFIKPLKNFTKLLICFKLSCSLLHNILFPVLNLS